LKPGIGDERWLADEERREHGKENGARTPICAAGNWTASRRLVTRLPYQYLLLAICTTVALSVTARDGGASALLGDRIFRTYRDTLPVL
jgi:hypothetical protein